MLEKLDARGLDALKEICNIGAGHAATALSQLTGRRITLEVPRVTLSPFKEVTALVGGPERIVAGLHLKILGETKGTILLLLPTESAQALLSFIGVPEQGDNPRFSENEEAVSSLKEVGNILASAYLTAISRLTGIVLLPSVPSFAYDMAGSIVDYVLIELGRVSDVALVVETNFLGNDDRIMGHVFLLPDPRSLAAILKAVSA